MVLDDEKCWVNKGGRMIEIPPIDDLCEALKEKFERQVRVNDKLREENEKLKSGIWKDEKMAELKRRYDQMEEAYFDGFPISKDEKQSISDWIKQHIEEKHNSNSYAGAIGGRFKYIFTPTSIGIIGEIECVCGDKYWFRELD